MDLRNDVVQDCSSELRCLGEVERGSVRVKETIDGVERARVSLALCQGLVSECECGLSDDLQEVICDEEWAHILILEDLSAIDGIDTRSRLDDFIVECPDGGRGHQGGVECLV